MYVEVQTFEDRLYGNHYKYDKEDEFRKDLFEFHGVTNNPKADLAYSIAWSRGHSSGFTEVASVFGDIVELIK